MFEHKAQYRKVLKSYLTTHLYLLVHYNVIDEQKCTHHYVKNVLKLQQFDTFRIFQSENTTQYMNYIETNIAKYTIYKCIDLYQ